MTVDLDELKPCPFCGGSADIERHGTQRQSMIVACTNCGARVESGDVVGLTTPERYAWNRRVADENARELRAYRTVCKDKPYLQARVKREAEDHFVDANKVILRERTN